MRDGGPGGPFDLVLVDGIHIYQQAADDLAGALPFMASRATSCSTTPSTSA